MDYLKGNTSKTQLEIKIKLPGVVQNVSSQLEHRSFRHVSISRNPFHAGSRQDITQGDINICDDVIYIILIDLF
jgi:hypothetical protein